MLDKPFEEDGRALTGRALALAAALDWPGAAEQAAAVLDDVIKRKPSRADAPVARASLLLLEGEPDKAVSLAEAATANPDVSPRVRYVIGRGLLAAGKKDSGLAAMKRYLEDDPVDPRAKQLVATGGREPALAPAAQADGRRALLGHARTGPAAQRDVRLRSGLAAHLANRRRAIRARNGPHRRVRDRPRAARGLRDGTRRGVAGRAQPGRRRGGRAREEGRPQHVSRREAEDAAAALAGQQARAVPRAKGGLAAARRGHDRRAQRHRHVPGAQRLDSQLPEAERRIRGVREEPRRARSKRETPPPARGAGTCAPRRCPSGRNRRSPWLSRSTAGAATARSRSTPT